MANEEKTKVLAAQTPLASADGVDAIAVRKGNGIELLAPAKLTVGAATKAKSMDTENIKGNNMSVTDFKNVLKNFVNRHNQGAVAQASLENTWPSIMVGTNQSATIPSGSTMSLTIVCKASNDYWSVLVVGYGLVDGAHLISYFNGAWSVYRFGMTSVTP